MVWNRNIVKAKLIELGIANYITKLRGLKPLSNKAVFLAPWKSQIISQNYVVWNFKYLFDNDMICRIANYITKLRGLKQLNLRVKFAYKKIANYITKLRGLKLTTTPCSDGWFQIANYITKLRGLKHKINESQIPSSPNRKLYHKTTWFETSTSAIKNSTSSSSQIISQNYVVWNSLTFLSV